MKWYKKGIFITHKLINVEYSDRCIEYASPFVDSISTAVIYSRLEHKSSYTSLVIL